MVYNEIQIEGGTDVAFSENVARRFEAYGWQVGGLPRERVTLDCASARVAVEAGIKLGWEHYVGLEGGVVGMDGFGASAPAEVLYQEFGLTADNLAAQARQLLKET